MKKLATLLLAAGMVVASTAPASAADVKLDGFYRYSFDVNSTGLEGQNIDRVNQRMRLGLSIAASENLSGYTQFQLGTTEWGTSPKHGKNDVQVRHMYIDWKVPAAPVKVRMGRSQFGLPADAFGGNTVMGASWGPRDGIVVTANATEWLDVTALWARAAAAANADGDWDTDQADKADVFGLAANLKFDGFSIAPWAAFSTMDASASKWGYKETITAGETKDAAPSVALTNTGKRVWSGLGTLAGLSNTGDLSDNDLRYASDSWYFGATATLTAFDPFKLVVAGAYGTREYTGAESEGIDDRKGWNVQAKASYKLGFGTPILAAWYASGDDADDVQFGGWIPSINGYTTPTTNFHDGSTSLTGSQANASISGTWAVQAGIEGMSFLSGLTHTAKVTYMQGTNNTQAAINNGADEAGYLTTSDSIVELSLDTDYAIYKNLIATLELAYLISDYDTSLEGRDALTEDDWRVALTFTYKF